MRQRVRVCVWLRFCLFVRMSVYVCVSKCVYVYVYVCVCVCVRRKLASSIQENTVDRQTEGKSAKTPNTKWLCLASKTAPRLLAVCCDVTFVIAEWQNAV